MNQDYDIESARLLDQGVAPQVRTIVEGLLDLTDALPKEPQHALAGNFELVEHVVASSADAERLRQERDEILASVFGDAHG